MNVMPETRRAH